MMKRLIAILLAAMMLLAVTAAFADSAEETEDAVPDTLLVTVDGVEIRENDEDLQYYYEYLLDMMDDPEGETDQHIARMDAMKELIEYAVIDAKVAAAYTEEETMKIKEEAREFWNAQINEILTESYGITGESTEEERQAALDEILAYLDSYYGVTEESYVESSVSNRFSEDVIGRMKEEDPSLTATEEDVIQALNEIITEERDEVASYAMYLKLSEEDPAKVDAMTDEELMEIYEGMSDEEKLAYSNDVTAYEIVKNYYENYYGATMHYVPEGYRSVTHILLSVDQELIDKWVDLSARYEESGEEDDGAEEPVTAEMVEEARRAILDSRQETIDEIMEKLANGASFEDLIVEYGTDPGMAEDAYLKTGYLIHKDGLGYDASFTAAAAALEKVGDHSEPLVSKYGIHILHYLRDIPAGALELSQDDKDTMKADIEDDRINMATGELLQKWVEEADIVWTAEGEAWKDDQSVRDAYEAELAARRAAEAEVPEETEEAGETAEVAE